MRDKPRRTKRSPDGANRTAHAPSFPPMQAESGSIRTERTAVFPGIWLEVLEVHAPSFRPHPVDPEHCIRIAHCGRGRLEYEGPDSVLSLHPGDLAIHPCVCKNPRLNCPLGYFHGLSILLDLEAAPKCASCLLDDVEVDLPLLFQRLLPGGAPFILRVTPQLEHVFSELYDVPPALQQGYYKVKTLELLLFLSRLDPSMSEAKQHICSKGEAALVKQVFAYIAERPHPGGGTGAGTACVPGPTAPQHGEDVRKAVVPMHPILQDASGRTGAARIGPHGGRYRQRVRV